MQRKSWALRRMPLSHQLSIYKLADELGSKGKSILPKNFYGYYDSNGNFTSEAKLGRNDANTIDFKMTNNDKAQYNIARGKAGEDAMTVALESIMFNRRTKDAKGHSIPRADAYTTAQKRALINKFKGKSTKDVVNWVMEQPEFKKASKAEQATVIKNIIGNGDTDTSKGAKRASELTVAQRHGVSEGEYDYKNELTKKGQQALDPFIESGVLTYEEAVDFARGAAKMGYYENEGGGYSRATYNQENIMNYLASADLSEEAKESLYNAFYTGKQTYAQALAKWGKGKGGYRRRGYRRRGYSRRGGSSKKKNALSTAASKPPTAFKVKASDYSTSKKTVAETVGSTPKAKLPKKKSAKVTPPNVKFKSYKI